MNARSVNQNNLTLRLRDDALNPEAGGLWFVGNGGNLLSDKLIQQRRLACVWSADEGDVSGAIIFYMGRCQALLTLLSEYLNEVD
jgi:hypothetical protein